MEIYLAHTGYRKRDLVLSQLGMPDIVDLPFLRSGWKVGWQKGEWGAREGERGELCLVCKMTNKAFK